MATKSKSKTTKKAVRKNSSQDSNVITAASGILFAGVAVAIMGNLQDNDDIKLLLIGFGAALLVVGGVLLSCAAKPARKK